MNGLQPALARLEARLQSLVEGSLARLFPADELRRELAQRLVHALRQETRMAPDGAPLAPDQFTIFFPPAQAAALQAGSVRSQALAVALGQELSLAAASAGVQFQHAPLIRLLPDPETSAAGISVLAQFSLDSDTGHTQGTSKSTAPLPALPLQAHEVPHVFLVLENGRVVVLEEKVTNLGRAASNHLVFEDGRVSELHAQIRLAQDHCTLFDLGSENGTFVNQRRINRYELQPGDVISLGGVLLIFGQEAGATAEHTQKIEGSL